jgi:hypothetical protein
LIEQFWYRCDEGWFDDDVVFVRRVWFCSWAEALLMTLQGRGFQGQLSWKLSQATRQ